MRAKFDVLPASIVMVINGLFNLIYLFIADTKSIV